MTHKHYFVLLLLLLNQFVYAAAKDEMHFSHLSVEHGLSQLSVLHIFQDADGYLWFGTRNGANQYNGYEFRVYQNEVNNESTLSDNNIRGFAQDEAKNIWIATSYGVNVIDYQSKAIKRFYPRIINPDCPSNLVMSFLRHADGSLYMSSSRYLLRCNAHQQVENHLLPNNIGSFIYSMTQDEAGDIYLGTEKDGLYIYTTDWQLKAHYPPDPDKGFPQATILTLLSDDNGYIWMGLEENGVCVYDKKTGTFQNYNQSNSGLKHNSVRSLIHYNDKQIGVGTFGGLHFIDKQNHTISPATVSLSEDGGGLSHYSIHSLLLDKDQTLWVGTYSAGVNYYSPYSNYISYIAGNSVNGIIGKGQEDKNGNMWFATEGSGLFFYNPRNGEKQLYPIQKRRKGNYVNNIIKSILIQDDTILCATHYGSVYLFSIQDKTYKKLYDYKFNDIVSLFIDSKSRLWIPTNSSDHLVRIEKNLQTNHFAIEDTTRMFSGVTHILELSPDRFLLGTLSDSIYLYDESQKTVCNLALTLTGDKTNIRLGSVTGLLKDKENYIWIATTKNGLFRLDDNLCLIKHYQKEDGLPHSQVNSLTIDSLQQVWITTGSSLYKLDRKPDLFTEVKLSNVPALEYTLHAGNTIAHDNRVYFPGDKGILGFNIGRTYVNPHVPKVYITSFRVNNKYEKLSEIQGREVALKAAENNIVIQFAALNYVHPEENLYVYRMDGVDADWHLPDHRREAYYTNLSPGSYTFRLRASNNDEIWTQDDTIIYITIAPPFYKTWWAYVFYLLCLAGVIVWFIRLAHKRQDRKREERYKLLEQQKEKTLHEERMRMFTNFSHELRTPLTLIINPLNDILQQISFSPEVKKSLLLMKKNTGRMLLLVNNLMDIRKYEAGKNLLQKSRFDFSSFINEIYDSFQSVAANRNITFTLDNQLSAHYPVFYDQSEIEKVFFNLLSNAFKFTPVEGTVALIVKRISQDECESISYIPQEQRAFLSEKSYLWVEIRDTGKGIDPQEIDKIFEPFYSGGNDVHHEISGTGIGLNLTRAIVKQHNGFIWATGNKTNGSVFSLLLPDTESQTTHVLPVSPDLQTAEIHRKVNLLVEETENKAKHVILLVDDNVEVLDYLKEKLVGEYVIQTAANGKQALDLLHDSLPDLIISDVMMPEVNGLSLCRQIKSDEAYSHIPLILLTAKSMVSQIEEGLDAGADDYIVKPFHTSLLKTRIRNLLFTREKLKQQTADAIPLRELGFESEALEDDFIKEYIDIIKANISNPEFDVSVIYETLGISRANFYRKVKVSTGLSPIDLIKNIRLEVSLKLLKETSLNVSEIAQQVGFSSRSYFARTFKSVYGISPTEFQRKNME